MICLKFELSKFNKKYLGIFKDKVNKSVEYSFNVMN